VAKLVALYYSRSLGSNPDISQKYNNGRQRQRSGQHTLAPIKKIRKKLNKNDWQPLWWMCDSLLWLRSSVPDSAEGDSYPWTASWDVESKTIAPQCRVDLKEKPRCYQVKYNMKLHIGKTVELTKESLSYTTVLGNREHLHVSPKSCALSSISAPLHPAVIFQNYKSLTQMIPPRFKN
jgi:hypothetical protein